MALNPDDCSVSQECISASFQAYPTIHTHDNGAENLVSVSEVMAAIVAPLECEHEQKQDSISASEMEAYCMTTVSEFKHENDFGNQSNISVHSVILEEKHLLSSNHKPDISNCKENTANRSINQADITNETDIVSSYDGSGSFSHQEVDHATVNVEPACQPEEQNNDVGMEIEQRQQQPHVFEVDVDVEEGGHPSALTLQAVKPNHDQVALVGPIMTSYQDLQTPVIYKGTALTGQDMPMATSSDTQTESMSFTDDFRYNLSVNSVPRLAATAGAEFQGYCENFLRGCKWSPDGNCVLTNSNDNCLRIFHPFDNTSTNELGDNKQIVSRVKMKECSQIYDFAWHSKMSLSQDNNCRIACTCSGIPIHLWDATTGQIVANYRAYDQFDEITAAYSLSFSLDGRNIYAGYNKAIRIFDTDYPVRSCRTVKTYNSQSKDGQTGIISCFTFSPDGNGLYVAGSYSRHIGMYDSACDKLVCLMQGQHGGVTHLMFSPDATKLYSGGRKDAEILCWDIRNMDKILFSALRDVKTNQRIYFDLSQSGRYLISGNNDGTVAFWDTLSPVEEINGDAFLKPCSQFQAHGDCVNGVSFNHQHNMVATASGQRHFRNFDYDSSDSAEDENMERAETWDFSLRLWQIPLLL